MKKITLILFLSIFIPLTVNAGEDGINSLSKSKNKNEPVKDCFEGLNRSVFAFNQALDTTLFEPLAKVYRYVPSPVRSSTSNFISNLSHLLTVPNNLLQGDVKRAANNTLRFTINTSVGILGLFDPATKMGVKENDKEDYGQTLGKWGFGPGCYIVLPILGPSTARDAAGTVAKFMGGDPWYNVTIKNDTKYFQEHDYYATRATGGVDYRAKNIESFENLEKNSIDFYASIKSLYLQDRQQKISNSEKITDTMDDSDWEEIENN